jgi:uncharacterized damage-inducible protein DinB
MLLSHFIQLFAYNAWANKRILDAAQGLAPEQFTAPTRFSFPSLRATLVHMLFAEWVWRRRLMGTSPLRSDKLIDAEDFPELAPLRAAWEQEAQAMREYLGALEEQELATSFKYNNTLGDPYQAIKANILTHMVMHAMQHRSEAAQMLTEFGHSPGDIDFTLFVREQS